MLFPFPLTNACLLSWWRKACGVVEAASHAVDSERRKHTAFNLIDENFENLNYIWNIFQEPHDFLIFTNSVTIYISLRSSQPKSPRKKHWRAFYWSGERSSLNLLKWDLSYLLNTFGDPSLRIIAAGKAPLAHDKNENYQTFYIKL